MANETQEDVGKTQKTIRHTGARVVISRSTDDETLERNSDAGIYSNN